MPNNKHSVIEQILTEGDWTLFLDRDGTINKRLPGLYINDWDSFEFIPGTENAISTLSQNFKYVIIVTNQQGIGKELMTHEELNLVHDSMTKAIIKQGGYIDQIYYCSDLEIFDPLCRKPNPGMPLQAQQDFPDIDFKKSVMVGDAFGDMKMGRTLNMFNVWIENDDFRSAVDGLFDLKVDSLLSLAQKFKL